MEFTPTGRSKGGGTKLSCAIFGILDSNCPLPLWWIESIGWIELICIPRSIGNVLPLELGTCG